MYQKDFIMRMIEMLAELVAGILSLIKKGNYTKASQSIENAYQEFLKQEARFFIKIPKDKLTHVLIQEHNYTNGHLEILSELFYLEAEVLYAQKRNEISLELYQKSLFLLDFVIDEYQTFSFKYQSKLAILQNRIAELENGVS